MTQKSKVLIVLVLLFNSCILNTTAQNLKKVFDEAEKQTLRMLGQINITKTAWINDLQNKNKTEVVSPRSLIAEGNLTLVPSRDWTSGFFPGVLWFLYEFTGKQKWETQARIFTSNIENEKLNGGTHDMGFKIYCSFGNGYRLTKDPAYREIIILSAKTLSTRFNPIVGCIRSWDHSRDKWGYPVIIDNMMNLELLFAATRLTGDSSFYKIAVTHANTTLKNHFRPDFSSYHVIDYDTITGKVLKKNTHQGYSHESAWARGQAWALYGYTMCYRETKDEKYLQQAEGIASFILNHPRLPEDLVPYWDFDASKIPDEPRDASAAAITASALYELSTMSKAGSTYRGKADMIIRSLTKNYRLPVGGAHGFILTHSTGSKPANSEVDVPLNYADYYYLEALLRQKKLNQK
jgi:unsaturated chondroitin disaccharide hydrolase